MEEEVITESGMRVEVSPLPSLPGIKIDPDAIYVLDEVAPVLRTYPHKIRDAFRDLNLPMNKQGANTYVTGSDLLAYLTPGKLLPKRKYIKSGKYVRQ